MRINGESVTGEKFGGVLMAFDLEPGEYQIEMKNRPQGAIPGALMSAGGILLFVCVVLLHRRRVVKKETAARRKPKRQPSFALPAKEEVIGEKPEEEIPDLDALDLVIEGEEGEEKDEV